MSDFVSVESVFPTFQEVVAHSLRIDPALVTKEKSLLDLGAESLDLIEITMECESAFNVWIPEKGILAIAGEVFGQNVIVQDGRISDIGKHMLAERIPPEDAFMLTGELTVHDVEQYFMRVGSWVNMIANLMRHCPTRCDRCQGALAMAEGFRLKCHGCGKEFQIPSGEEINREWLQQYRDTRYLPTLQPEQHESLSQTA